MNNKPIKLSHTKKNPYLGPYEPFFTPAPPPPPHKLAKRAALDARLEVLWGQRAR